MTPHSSSGEPLPTDAPEKNVEDHGGEDLDIRKHESPFIARTKNAVILLLGITAGTLALNSASNRKNDFIVRNLQDQNEILRGQKHDLIGIIQKLRRENMNLRLKDPENRIVLPVFEDDRPAIQR